MKRIISLIAIIILIGLLMFFFGPSESLDAKLYYTGNQAISLFKHMEKIQVKIYLYNEILDLLLITSYSLLFYLCVMNLYPQNFKIRYLCLLPGGFDLIETFSVLLIINRGGPYSILHWLGIITLFKWTTGLLIVGLIFKGYLTRKLTCSTP